MTVHFLASLLSGDPASVKVLQRALRGRSMQMDTVMDYAQELSDRAREGDTDAVKQFERDLSVDDLIGKVITDEIIVRIGDQGITGRSIDTENDDHYEGDDDGFEDVNESERGEDEVHSQEG